MKRRVLIRVAGLFTVLVLLALAVRDVGANQESAAFQEQLRLARREGIPTSAAEFAATMPAAKPSDNAAPLYRELRLPFTRMGDPTPIDADVVFHPDRRNLSAALNFLARNQDALRIIDQAVLRPRCWFDRDWTEGYGVPTPELADTKAAAKLVALRGSVAAAQGDVAGALADIRRVLVMAKHAGEEPTEFCQVTKDAIFIVALRNLAYWAFVHRDRVEYREALKQTINGLPEPNVKLEHSRDLYLVLNLVDLCSTSEGRRKLEVDESRLPNVDKYALFFGNRDMAKAEIVRAERECWSVFDKPIGLRASLLNIASDDLHLALDSFPTAEQQFDAFDGGNDPSVGREGSWAAKRQLYIAALRALARPKIPVAIKTSDLLSPFRHKPLRYSYDGRQITISTSGYRLEIPPMRGLDAKEGSSDAESAPLRNRQ